MIDGKEYAKQMRENAVIDNNGIVKVSKELWCQIADVIEEQQAEIERLTENNNQLYSDLKLKENDFNHLYELHEDARNTVKEANKRFVAKCKELNKVTAEIEIISKRQGLFIEAAKTGYEMAGADNEN